MKRNYAAGGATAHDHMAAALTHLFEPEPLKNSNHVPSR
jgi:hypothetical protein